MGNERIRKVKSYYELCKTPLTRRELDDTKEKIVDYIDEIRSIKTAKEEANAAFNQRIKHAEAEQEKLHALYKSKSRQSNDLVEEWLLGNNEIERVNTRTGEIIGTRTAEQQELQENLPFVAPSEAALPVSEEADFEADFEEGEEGEEEEA